MNLSLIDIIIIVGLAGYFGFVVVPISVHLTARGIYAAKSEIFAQHMNNILNNMLSKKNGGTENGPDTTTKQ